MAITTTFSVELGPDRIIAYNESHPCTTALASAGYAIATQNSDGRTPARFFDATGYAPIGFDNLAIGAWSGGVKIAVRNGQIVYLDHAATHIAMADIDAGDFLFA